MIRNLAIEKKAKVPSSIGNTAGNFSKCFWYSLSPTVTFTSKPPSPYNAISTTIGSVSFSASCGVKLTKTGEVLLKEGSHNSSFETVLLVDIGLKDQTSEIDKHVLSKSLAFAMSMSEKLLLKNIGHYVALYDQGSFYWLEMNSLQNYYQNMENWISKGITSQGGDALHLFASEHLDLYFTKMIYVTAGDFNEELSRLNDFLSISAITIKNDIQKVQTIKHLQNQLYELPLDSIDQNMYHFEI